MSGLGGAGSAPSKADGATGLTPVQTLPLVVTWREKG